MKNRMNSSRLLLSISILLLSKMVGSKMKVSVKKREKRGRKSSWLLKDVKVRTWLRSKGSFKACYREWPKGRSLMGAVLIKSALSSPIQESRLF